MCILAVSCKIQQAQVATEMPKLPSTYITAVDTLDNTAMINWREYFKDEFLVGLIDTALQSNFDVLAIMQRMEVSRAYIKQTKGNLFPTIEGFTNVAQRKFGLYTMDGAGNITTPIYEDDLVPIHLPDYHFGLQASWEADVWGKLRSMKKAALSRYLASIEAKNWAVTNLISEVASVYYELLAMDEQQRIIAQTISLQENALEIVNVQKQVGAANELAVQQFEAQLLNSKGLEIEIAQSIVELESRINMLLGRLPQKINRNADQFNETEVYRVSSGVPSHLLQNRPDVRQAEFNVAASKADLRAARAAFYPSVNISAALGLQAFNTSFLLTTPESVAYTLLGGLVAPLVNRAAIDAEFRVAKAAQSEALYNYQRSIINGYVEVYNELNNVQNLERLYLLKREEAHTLTRSVETSTELFRTGRANYLEVIVAQENTIETRLELTDVKRRQLLSTVNLYKALGGGWR